MTTTPKAEATNITALIGAVAEQGRKFTDARNALVAHALATGTKASVIVAESGLDKGDVSRINKALQALSPAATKSVKGLVVSGMSAANASSLTAAITLGEKYFRRAKVAAGSKAVEPKSAAGEDENSDMTAVVFDFIVNAPDFAAAVALINEAVAAAEQAVAERAAEADAA